MTPAALNALLKGDTENFIAAATPGGIEAQEKQGQMDQSFAETLPIDGTKTEEQRKQFEALGFVFGEKADDLFVNVIFPKGWRKKLTDHSMWTHIVDEQGRERGSIFYKAAFYDRSAHASLSRRFGIADDQYEDGHTGPVTVFVDDQSKKIEKKITGLLNPSDVRNSDREEWGRRYDSIRDAGKELEAWLTEKFPKWQSPVEYWED